MIRWIVTSGLKESLKTFLSTFTWSCGSSVSQHAPEAAGKLTAKEVPALLLRVPSLLFGALSSPGSAHGTVTCGGRISHECFRMEGIKKDRWERG